MAFAGLRGTGDWGTGERPQNFREMILWSNPNGAAPLFALLSKAKKQSVDDPQFHWFEEKLTLPRVQINYGTGYSTTATSIVIDSGGLNLVAGDLLMAEKAESAVIDNEIMTVVTVTSDTALTISRGSAGTIAATQADDIYLQKIGNAFEEGTTGPDISQRNPTKLTNYTQIFKTAVGITGTAKETRARTGDALMNDKKRKSFDHSAAIEMAMMFGRAYEDTTGSKPKRYMGGLRQFITTNTTIFTTTPTEDTFLSAVYPVFNYNVGGAGDERIILCGNGFLNSLNKLVRDSSNTQIRYDGPFKLYGMNLQRWVLPQGTVGIKSHPLMNNHARFTYSAFILDAASLIYRPLRDTRFKNNTQANDKDSIEGMWLTECGLEVQNEHTCGYIGNFVK